MTAWCASLGYNFFEQIKHFGKSRYNTLCKSIFATYYSLLKQFSS